MSGVDVTRGGDEGEPVTSIAIGVPVYGLVTLGFYTSMLSTALMMRERGVPMHTIHASGDSLVQRARNNIVAEFMATDASHLMFIDTDIEWNPDDILRLVGHGKDMVCGAYPKKQFPPVFALQPLLDEQGRSQRDPDTGAVRIRCAATGFLMIRRAVIERMMAAYPELRYRAYASDGITEAARGYTYSLFDTITEPDAFYSEDYGFCVRWERIGGEVWVDPAIQLKHHGPHAYEADASRMFRAVDEEKPKALADVLG